jgi:hypothetical protein
MAALDAVGIMHSGRAGELASWQQNGLRIAMIAFSPTVDSWPLLSTDIATDAIRTLAFDHDIVIVSFHGGAEGPDATRLPFEEEFYLGETRGEVVRFAHRVIDAGADLVLGHGPHVPRAMELYGDRLIAYSLGNFATHFGVSVDGMAGWAPILSAEIGRNGEFLSGRIYSALQERPDGPRWDVQSRAFELIRTLTEESFGRDMFSFGADGSFSPGLNRPP